MATRRNSTTDPTNDSVSADEFVPEQMTDQEIRKASGQDIVPATRFSTEEYGRIESFDDAMALVTASYGDVISAHEQPLLGDGFHIATEDDKMRLIGVPLLLLDWRFMSSDYGKGDYVTIHAVSRDDSGKAVKWILNDGGTGIAKDLHMFTEKTGRDGGMGVRKGLQVSNYPTDPETGKPLTKQQVRDYILAGKDTGKGRTFYLDTSA